MMPPPQRRASRFPVATGLRACGPGGRRGTRGSVIVVILALITLAAFLISGFVERSLTEMLVESRARIADRLRADAHSALEGTLAVLADYQAADNGLRSPAQGWGEPLEELGFPARPGTTVEVRFEDETGRISLPRLDAPELEQLGVYYGLREDQAKLFAEALVVWTKANGSSTRFETDPRNYEYRDPPHRPPGRALASFGELAAIAGVRDLLFTDGQPNAVHERFVQGVSLFDFPASNLNSATADTLAFAGLDDGQSQRLLDLNSGAALRTPGRPPYFRSVAEARTDAGITGPLAGLDTRVYCLRITVTVREGGTAFHLIATIRPGGSSAGAEARTNAANAPGGTNNGSPPDNEAAAAKSLNYPFTILALEEKIELAPPPAA